MTPKRLVIVLALTAGALSLVALVPRGTRWKAPTATVAAQSLESSHCKSVGGTLMTNIAAIDDTYNLGPVFGDLAGSVAAKFLSYDVNTGKGLVRHYWITQAGEFINFSPSTLNAVPISSDKLVVAIPWGSYESDIIPGGTGKFKNATGHLEYLGMADLGQKTLVIRYRGQVCFTNGGDD